MKNQTITRTLRAALIKRGIPKYNIVRHDDESQLKKEMAKMLIDKHGNKWPINK